MQAQNREQLISQQEWRYAVKKFDANKKISPQDWQALEQSLVLTPSSYGLQPWKFLVVQSPELRKKLRAVSWNQSQVEDCSHYVVFAFKKKMDAEHIQAFLQRTAEVRQQDLKSLEAYGNMMLGDLVNGPRAAVIDTWASRQSYIALGNLMTSAASLGIDSCPLEGLDPQKYDELLGLKDSGYATVVACALGFRSHEDKYAGAKKVRFPTKDLVKFY